VDDADRLAFDVLRSWGPARSLLHNGFSLVALNVRVPSARAAPRPSTAPKSTPKPRQARLAEPPIPTYRRRPAGKPGRSPSWTACPFDGKLTVPPDGIERVLSTLR
jgi:hypothetical protein